MIFSSDDLPAPLRPIRPSRSPASSENAGVVEQGDVAEGEVGVGEGKDSHGRPIERRDATSRDRPPATSRASARGQRGLERVDEHRRDVEAGLLRDLLEAGRAGDVDLGQAVADHVEADQQQPARAPAPGRWLGDLAVARASAAAPRPCRRPPGCRGSRCPAECAPARSGTGLPPITRMRLSPLHDLGQVALHHHRLRRRCLFSVSMMRAEVQAVGADAEDAHAAHAVERLQDDVAGARRGRRARRPRRASPSVGAMNCGNSRIASFSGWSRSAAGLVEDARAFALGLLAAGGSRRSTRCRTAGPCASAPRRSRRSARRRRVGRAVNQSCGVAGERDLAHAGASPGRRAASCRSRGSQAEQRVAARARPRASSRRSSPCRS